MYTKLTEPPLIVAATPALSSAAQAEERDCR
jgi:hypothetical protein